MKQLKQLESYFSVSEKAAPLMFDRITTPLVYPEWAKQLKFHQDSEFCNYVLNGIANGFRIGFDPSKAQCVCAKRNMQSAQQHSLVVEEYLEKEVSMKRIIIGPLGDKPSNK